MNASVERKILIDQDPESLHGRPIPSGIRKPLRRVDLVPGTIPQHCPGMTRPTEPVARLSFNLELQRTSIGKDVATIRRPDQLLRVLHCVEEISHLGAGLATGRSFGPTFAAVFHAHTLSLSLRGWNFGVECGVQAV